MSMLNISNCRLHSNVAHSLGHGWGHLRLNFRLVSSHPLHQTLQLQLNLSFDCGFQVALLASSNGSLAVSSRSFKSLNTIEGST